MSDAAMADFVRVTSSFSREDIVSAISILTERLGRMFAKEREDSLAAELLADREEVRAGLAAGTLETYSTMEEYRRAKSV